MKDYPVDLKLNQDLLTGLIYLSENHPVYKDTFKRLMTKIYLLKNQIRMFEEDKKTAPPIRYHKGSCYW